jgi:hypothetical protein
MLSAMTDDEFEACTMREGVIPKLSEMEAFR